MTNKELIALLQACPEDAVVQMFEYYSGLVSDVGQIIYTRPQDGIGGVIFIDPDRGPLSAASVKNRSGEVCVG
jgi:hypothetical protein